MLTDLSRLILGFRQLGPFVPCQPPESLFRSEYSVRLFFPRKPQCSGHSSSIWGKQPGTF